MTGKEKRRKELIEAVKKHNVRYNTSVHKVGAGIIGLLMKGGKPIQQDDTAWAKAFQYLADVYSELSGKIFEDDEGGPNLSVAELERIWELESPNERA